MHSCIQYSGLLSLSNSHSTDSGLDHRTPQIHFNTRTSLFGSAVIPFTAPPTLASLYATFGISYGNSPPVQLSPRYDCHSCCPLPVYATSALLKYPTLFQLVVPEATGSLILFREGAGIVASLVVWRQRLCRSPRY